MTLLQGERLTCTLKQRQIVQDVDISVGGGELVGLLGPNGAGKSTLLKMLAGLLRPTSGRVLLAGRELAHWPAQERARRLAYLPQSAECHWDLHVAEVVALGRLPHRAPWAALDAHSRQAIAQAMQQADVQSFAKRPIGSLSGGEKTRVLLARALAGEPAVLLADEPVTGLDPAHQLAVMALLQQLAGQGAAVVAVLHDLHLAARYCSRIVLLHEGRVAAQDTPAAALTPALLARCYGIRAYTAETGSGRILVPLERVENSDG